MKYPFDVSFQRRALKFLITQRPVDLASVLLPDYFDEFETKQVISFILDHLKKGNFPTLEIIRAGCGGVFLNSETLTAEKTKILGVLDEVMAMDINADEIQELLITFIKTQRHRQLLTMMNEDFVRGSYEFEDYTRELMDITNFDVNRDDGILYSKSGEIVYPDGNPMPTHLPTLNRWLNGGLCEGEVGIVMAQTGFGKSYFLINIAAAAYLIGKTAFYYTFELSAPQIKRRLDARVSGFTSEEQREKAGKTKERLKKFSSRGGEIIIKEFPSGDVTVNGIIGHINLIGVKHGLKPDVVVVDYIDEVKPFHSTGDDWKELGDITRALRGQVAGKMNTRVWSASQIKTDAYNRRFDLTAMRRSMEKANIVDVALALYKSEKEPDTMIVEMLKGRRVRTPKEVIRVRMDFNHGLMEEKITQVPPAQVKTGEREKMG